MHALWALSGMDALDWKTAVPAVADPHPYVRATALRVLEPLVDPERASRFVELVGALLERGESDPIVLQQAILSLGPANRASDAFGVLLKLYQKRRDSLGHTALLSALHQREDDFLDHLARTGTSAPELEADVAKMAHHAARAADLAAGPRLDLSSLSAEQTALARLGAEKYAVFCTSCHQPHGHGTEGLAPPLARSEWVTGPPERLAQIVLRGLVGPVKVRGREWNLHMPGLGNTGVVDDRELAGILTFIRRAWGNRAEPIDPGMVKHEREKSKDRKFPWTAAELSGESDSGTIAAITPGNDGLLVLPSRAASLSARKLRYHPDLDIIGPWVEESDAALWKVDVPAAAAYQVELTYAMDDKNAGNSWAIESEGAILEGRVASTGGFDQFDKVEAGTLSLKKGINRILMRPAGAPDGELIDLRMIRLVPE
ncbi:MAG: hypothetical protein GWO24_08210 [Akkermansiaceae bacterium]|nr:hypothetical protein [Akkermansiaceae bacterium]